MTSPARLMRCLFDEELDARYLILFDTPRHEFQPLLKILDHDARRQIQTRTHSIEDSVPKQCTTRKCTTRCTHTRIIT
ncbi:hypothetical protein CspeluHIS016_0501840 [Cutaneotrichosporon spelunceum]|uniref:Uncharacterized protein n=1 Tax=Cutaneotrichosporon spelunceum TaxID=1672016 RepID=A0AAD3TXB9_9TREE|nr:hypothetical protein CspeluHIS016_0501840 [Cutaneotrichosporon spelunceum]